jgi:hypothetical protein
MRRMSVVELVVATVFGLLGIRSVVHWLRRPIESIARRDLVLYALFVAARAGLWFALMGLFLLFASVETKGRAFIDDAASFNWYFIVLAVPAALQFVTGFLLGRPPPGGADGDRDA